MSKKKALIVFTFIDILALLALWLGYNEINKIFSSIADSADTISLNSRVGFFSFGIGIPMAHIFAICDYFFLYKIFPKKDDWVNGAFIILGIVLFVNAFFLSAYMRTYVEKAGYLHCAKADDQMTFTTYLMYTKSYEICSQLVEEKRNAVIHKAKVNFRN